MPLIRLLSAFLLLLVRPSAAQDANWETLQIYQSWRDEGVPNGQCAGRMGEFTTPFGALSDAIKFDTDNREGGCEYRLAIIDPDAILAARQWQLSVIFTPQGHIGQCKYPGTRAVPIVGSIQEAIDAWTRPPWREPILIDTDDRVGGCVLEFQISGPDSARSPVLDITYVSDGGPEQCPQAGEKFAALGHPAAMIIDTDGRPGGCLMQLRLRK